MITNPSQKIFVAVEHDMKRTAYWRIRAGAKRPELFFEQEGQGERWHLSLHESGQWHMKVDGQVVLVWQRPKELVPGFTRAVGILLPPAAVAKTDPSPAGCVLVRRAAGSDAVVLDVFFEAEGADLASWPGRNGMNTVFVGRLALGGSDGGTWCVVAHFEPLAPGTATGLRLTANQVAEMRKAAAAGQLFATIIGEFADGAIALLNVRAAASADGGLA